MHTGLSAFILYLTTTLTHAATWVVQPSDALIGEIQYQSAQGGETLGEIGINHDMGYLDMVHANPGIDPDQPLPEGVRITIPSRYILPGGIRQGLVINLAEYRLYYFPKGDNIVITMPVGIGRQGWDTPTGVTSIVGKVRDPLWHPTAKLMEAAEQKGIMLPDEFPSGEGNPLGRYALKLAWPTYLIHGTNRRDGVGTRVSAGCIRMLPEDIEYLFGLVPVGTPVHIVNIPVKTGYSNGHTWLEAHPPLGGHKNLKRPDVKGSQSALVTRELRAPSGIPREIG